MTDRSLILLNIENIDEDVEFDLNKNDREIFFKDIEIPDRDIDSFIFIDEYIDYIKLNFVKSKESRDLLKLCAEYMAVEISRDNMHTISFKKGKELYKENMRKLRVNNVKYIISVEDRKNGKDINSTITVPFTSKIFVKELNKIFLYPFDKPIKEGKPKLLPVYNVNTTNINIKNDINRSFDLKEKRFLIPKDINNLKYTILRNLNNVQKTEKDYHFINEISSNTGSDNQFKTYTINDQLNFLKSKPSKDGKNIQNLYYSFDINNNINLLEKIINLGFEDEYISLILTNLNKEIKLYSIYEENINLLIKQNAKQSRLEQICKIKYPNFFNPSRKEFTFGKGTKFSIDLLPVDYKKSLLLEFNIRESLENKMISNKCEHKSSLDYLRKNTINSHTWNEFKSKFLTKNGANSEKSPIVPCNLCEMPTLCIHEIEFNDMFCKNYENKKYENDIINQTERINQIITTKYASKSKSSTSSYSSFCKHCGMQILNMVNTDGIGYDESQNMYSDPTLNTGGLNTEINEDRKTILYAINRNISFTKPVGKTTVNSIISGIYENLQPILRILNKKKNIKLQSALSKEMNIVILTIVSIMILSISYDFIEIKNTSKLKKSIIISSKDRNVKGVGLKFREAWEAFNNNYETMIKQSSFSNKTESLKQLFVKSYDLLKENLQENILLSESYNLNNTSVYQEYLDRKKLKSSVNEDYKNKSYNLFSLFINNNLGDIYLSDRKENQLWNEWEKESKEISKMENKIIQLNIKKILYPYSRINYSYDRYYKSQTNNSDLSLYACSISGKQHVWGKYIFKSKDNKEVSFDIKTISSKDNDLNIIKNSKIHALECKICKKNTNQLIKDSTDKSYLNGMEYSDIIINRIVDLTEIDSFYSTYRYRCLNSPFHNFKYKDGNYHCNSCQMDFNFIVTKDEAFYLKSKKIFESFKKQKSIQKNEELFNYTNQNIFIKQLDIEKNIKIEANKNKEIMGDKISDKIKDLNSLNVNFKKNCLENLGESESILESEYYDNNISSIKYNDVFSKNLDKVRQIIIYLGIIINTPYKHKYIKDEDFLNIIDHSNSSNVRNELSVLYKYLINLKVIDSFHAYRSINPDGTNGAINYIKSFILHLIKQIGSINKEISQFILDKIIDSDIIYTSYSYAELKKTYNMNKIIEDQFNSAGVDDELESPEDDYDLFDSSDLSMNNFADDDLE
jgi:hypothetical protein